MLLNKQPLNEVYFVEQTQISKSVFIDNDGIMTVRNVLLSKADEKNKNNRIYPKRIVEREFNKLKPVAINRALRGSLDHPSDSVANMLRDGSHLITNIFWDSTNPNHIRGDIEILKTPLGGLIEVYIKQRSPVGISSRGEGSLKYNDGYYEVQDDFHCVTWDIVSDQSTFGAILNEARQNGSIPMNQFTDEVLDKYYKEHRQNTQILEEQIKKMLGGTGA